MTVQVATACPCGAGRAFPECCGRFIGGANLPTTAEELMRSRYTAYHLKAVDYLVETTHPDRRGADLREQIAAWSKHTQFLSLQVLRTQGGLADDNTGKVEFVARYLEKGKLGVIRENSRFKRYRKRWMYLDGVHS